jgi:hypothetical protein
VHQCRDDVLEHDPVGDPAAVTTSRMARGELQLFEQRRELDPDGFEQG